MDIWIAGTYSDVQRNPLSRFYAVSEYVPLEPFAHALLLAIMGSFV